VHDNSTEPAGFAWGDDISTERKHHLEALLEQWEAARGRGLRVTPEGATWPSTPGGVDDPDVARWLGGGDAHWPFGPFSTSQTEDELTGSDVFWLAARALAGLGGSIDAAAQRIREARTAWGGIEVLDFTQLELQGSTMDGAKLDGALLRGAQMQRASLWPASLRSADLEDTLLTGALLEGSDLEYANLRRAQLSSASLQRASLRGAVLSFAHLEGADLRGAIFDSTTSLEGAFLSGALFDQAVLGDVNLTVVDWSAVPPLGDQTRAEVASVAEETEITPADLRPTDQVLHRQPEYLMVWRDVAKPDEQRAEEYHAAARAYRALSVALRSQGIPREPTRFHYWSELMERRSLYHQARRELATKRRRAALSVGARWMFSFLLGTLTGYGDRLGRLALTYIGIVLAFAALFVAVNRLSLTPSNSFDSLSLSVTAFHGRGLLASSDHIARSGAWLAAIESVTGLFVEALFVAAFTRRVIVG
jgi:uncharacterized protein YjbI with pentapeptide repeats